MNQTNWIAAYLLIGFVVYITVKGQLTDYRQVLGIGSSNATSTVPQSTLSTLGNATPGETLQGLQSVLPSLPSLAQF